MINVLKNWKLVICVFYLLLQVFLIFSARFSSNRYFTWAPHDIQTEYFLNVYAKNVKLDNLQLDKRYGLQEHSWIDLPANHLIKYLTEYERIFSNSQTDSILLRYNVNGKKWIHWKWTPSKETKNG